MKAIVFHEHGGTDRLRYEDFPEPEPGHGECLVRVRAFSLNGFDPMILAGSTSLKTPLPMIPCGDVAGEIAALGPGVDPATQRVGARVSVVPFVPGRGMLGETALGGACEYVAVPATHLLPIPDAVSDVDAAALPIAYATALRMMRVRGRVGEGDRVLLLGATGGVGTCCVQLAKTAGAEVIACGSAPWKLERLREIGADHVIDTSREDFVSAVHALWGKPHLWKGGGASVVVNYIGGDSWARSLRVLGRQGRLLTCGATAGYSPETDIRYIWTYELELLGSNGWTPQDQRDMLQLVAERQVRPVLHAVRSIEQTAESIQELIDRKVFGKIVLQP